MTPNGSGGWTEKVIHNFGIGDNDGNGPLAGLIFDGAGNLYGTTQFGGNNTSPKCVLTNTQTCGTVFSLSVGLPPFVAALPNSGKAGKAVKLLGNDLSGTTAVSFNGTAATFTVASSTAIETTVPAGATTGYVSVTIPSGMLSSNVPFQVR